MYLTHIIASGVSLLVYHATIVSAAPPRITMTGNILSSPLQANNFTLPGGNSTLDYPFYSHCPWGNEEYHLRISETNIELSIIVCQSVFINRLAVQWTFATAIQYFGDKLGLYSNSDIDPDPYKSPRVPSVNCSMSVHSFNNPAHGIVKHLTNEAVYLTLNFMLGWYATDPRDVSTVTVINVHGAGGVFDPVGALTVRPWKD